MKQYILREYGSWGVMALSYLAGLIAGGRVTVGSLTVFLALALYINSKQALVLWLRRRKERSLRSLAVFIVQVLAASVILLSTLGEELTALMPYALAPCVYLLCLRLLGEHAVITEISGFVLLALSALVAKVTTTGEVDPTLFTAVAVFFAAGVFKVRIRSRKGISQRLLMIAYVGSALVVYWLIHVPLLVLLPLIDNLIFSVTLYPASLRMTGWLEVFKGVIFVFLMALYYN